MSIAIEDSEHSRKGRYLNPDAFLTFGLPRAKLASSRDHSFVRQSYHQNNHSYVSEPSTTRSKNRLYRKGHEL